MTALNDFQRNSYPVARSRRSPGSIPAFVLLQNQLRGFAQSRGILVCLKADRVADQIYRPSFDLAVYAPKILAHDAERHELDTSQERHYGNNCLLFFDNATPEK